MIICAALMTWILCCGACGQSYELILDDSAAEAEAAADAGESNADAGKSSTAAGESSEGAGGSTAGACESSTPVEAGTASAEPRMEDAGAETPADAEPEQICVYVCGAVQKAGVYTLAAGSRVYEAVAAAGGLTEEAEPRALNQAQLLEDGQQITVYTREEAAQNGNSLTAGSISSGTEGTSAGRSGAADSGVSGSGAADGVVNLNTAGREELMTLSGVGEARADAIIAYREENGAFTSAEEIMQIDGIGQKSYEKLKNRITV
ncbi:MAG: helix-hairpin-helix domain-containing protein [Eubacterium sp.]|nr:helix-hairpin-helix domain-containing protein [Eubacterium sp.]